MKKILLLAVAAVMVTTASAQYLHSSAVNKRALQKKSELVVKPQAQKMEMHKASDVNLNQNAPKKAGYVDGFYKRPAGAFTGYQMLEGGAWGGGFYAPFIMMKPFVPYTFESVMEGVEDPLYLVWGYELWVQDETGAWSQEMLFDFEHENLEVQYDYEYDDAPSLYVLEGEGDEANEVFGYQMGGYEMGGSDENPIAGAFHSSTVLAYPNFENAWGEEGVDLLLSSKTFCYGGRHGDQRYLMTYYSGCDPWGDNEEGWWFGKNGGRANGMPIDGIAQAFEKPAYPYLLKQVVLETTGLVVDAPVEMTCKVYRLEDGIPAYDPERAVALPEEPGELIATGTATVTPETNEAADGFIIFTLYGEEDGLPYEITPTIDDAILIAIDGYNDPGMENLHDFSALVSADTESDEGYGELAYIKYGLSDEDGNFSGEYVWAGLNNFFSTGTMMTGMSIFITAETPFLIYNWSNEDGEFTFPDEGGLMEKFMGIDQDGNEVYTRSIEFFSWVPSVDEGWTLTCDGDDVPEWLSIELTDGEDEEGEFDNHVNAEVVAEALPEGVTYREAIVRFEFPGAYLDYTFKQGVEPPTSVFDVNGDGEVNIGDVNELISMILKNNQASNGDCNQDGEVNIADVNALIDAILTKKY